MSGSRVVEYANRNRLAELLLRDGFGVFVPLIDTGIDMIAHHEKTREIRLIQQKSRWTIDKKYHGRDLWVAFPDATFWYLVPHDHLVETAHESLADTISWRDRGLYHRSPLSATQRVDLSSYRIGIAD